MSGDYESKDQWLQVALGIARELFAPLEGGDSLPRSNGAPAKAQKDNSSKNESKNSGSKTATKGTPGKNGNVLYGAGKYIVSLPVDTKGTFPLVVIFAGNTGKSVMVESTPPSYFAKALVVFGERDGKFADISSLLAPLLEENQIQIGSVTICGYSSGGQAAFANYEHADKAVGLIDPNVQKKDFSKFDSKTIYSFYDPNPESWNFPADPADDKYTVGQARIDAFDLVKKAGGYAEKTKQSHEGYPKYFLSKFESKLL